MKTKKIKPTKKDVNDFNYRQLNHDFLIVINYLIAKDLSFSVEKDGNEITINVGHIDYQIYMLMLDDMKNNDYNIVCGDSGRIEFETVIGILKYINK